MSHDRGEISKYRGEISEYRGRVSEYREEILEHRVEISKYRCEMVEYRGEIVEYLVSGRYSRAFLKKMRWVARKRCPAMETPCSFIVFRRSE
jgi:hypothetical protein